MVYKLGDGSAEGNFIRHTLVVYCEGTFDLICVEVTHHTVSVFEVVLTGVTAEITHAPIPTCVGALITAVCTPSVLPLVVGAGHTAPLARTVEEIVCTVGGIHRSVATADIVCAELDSHRGSKVAHSGIFAESYFAIVGECYPVAVEHGLVVVHSETLLEEELEACRILDVVVLSLVGNNNGVVDTAGHISALGAGRTVKGVVTYHTAVFTAVDHPIVLTYVSTYSAYTLNACALVHTSEATLYTPVAVPFVIAGQTAPATFAGRPPAVVTYLAADRTYAVGEAVLTGYAALGTVVVHPLVLTLGRGRHRAANKIELKYHTAVHEVAVLFEGYLFIVPIYGHPVCAVCYGFLVGGAEIFTDKFAESDLVANLVFVFLISNENIISGE